MKGLRRTEGRGVTSTPWANSLLCIHQYSQVHKKLPASLAAVLGHVTEFSPMIWRKGCITLKDQLNIINFSFIRGSGCCPYPEGPWVTIQLPKANYITTWKGEELSFDQAKEQKRSVTWGHLNIFYNTPLLFFAFWHQHLREIWTRSPMTYPRLASNTWPTAAASDTRAEHCRQIKSQRPAPISP